MEQKTEIDFLQGTQLIDRLAKEHHLSMEEYEQLIVLFQEAVRQGREKELMDHAAQKAVPLRKQYYGTDIYLRGLIEISNICKNDCLYCGIRKSNHSCERYRLSPEEILECCDEGYELGFRTYVLQGGEDGFFTDEVLTGLIREIKRRHPDCAVTLSLGERSRESYQTLYDAGADRYLLRHETADPDHYKKLHPEKMSFDNRMECLRILRDIGYQVGCGFMVGSPYQTPRSLAMDLKFIEGFQPEMCGIGPFIPHHATPFAQMEGGTLNMTLYLLSLLRLIMPNLLLPATTALGTIHPRGREMGILAGGNVVMPNLSPVRDRKKYELYDNKICTGDESAQCRHCMEGRMRSIGYDVVTDRGDAKSYKSM